MFDSLSGSHTEYYISSGAQNKMYTLRRMMQVWSADFFNEQDTYIKTLSNDEKVAREKAMDFIKKANPKQEIVHFFADGLNPIYRFPREERERMKAEEKQRKEDEKTYLRGDDNYASLSPEERTALIEQRKREKQEIYEQYYINAQIALDENKILFGKYQGEYSKSVFKVLPLGYIKYIYELTSEDNFIVRSASTAQMKLIGEQYLDLLNSIEEDVSEIKKSSQYQGEIGKKLTNISVVCKYIFSSFVYFNDYSGTEIKTYIVWDKEGNVYKISYSGYSWDMEENKKYIILTGKVKDHVQYKGIDQTVLNYVKIEEIE